MTDDERILIELDGRRRASLARLGRPEHRRYLARVEPDGTIVLTPARVVPADELARTDHLAVIDEIAALPDPSASSREHSE
jgi:hypothetical protein